MVGLGILQEITGRKRNREFSYLDYISLFGELDPEPSEVTP